MRLVGLAFIALVGCASNGEAIGTTEPSALTSIGALNICVESIAEEGTAAANSAVEDGDSTAIQRTINACRPAQSALDGQLRGLVVERQLAAEAFLGTIEDGTATETTARQFNDSAAAWFNRVAAAAQPAVGP
jgi:hypothetical protein